MNGTPKRVRRREFAKGEAIFVQGDPSDHAYFVQKGSILMTRRSDKGPVAVTTINEKQVFGEMALLDEESRPLTATAREPTTCIILVKQEFQAKLQDTDPLVRAHLRVLTRKLSEPGSTRRQPEGSD
jgi:diguanylate cyclase